MHFDIRVFSNYQMYILVLCSHSHSEDMNFFEKMNIKIFKCSCACESFLSYHAYKDCLTLDNYNTEPM